MAQAKLGDKVRVRYTGSLKDGSVFDSNEKKDPFEFTLGEKKVIPGFEIAVIGMSQGDRKTVQIPADDAYGEHRKDLVVQVPRSQIPAGVDLQAGCVLQVRSQKGLTTDVIVIEFDEESVTMDGNHPLSGEDLTFKIELLEIL